MKTKGNSASSWTFTSYVIIVLFILFFICIGIGIYFMIGGEECQDNLDCKDFTEGRNICDPEKKKCVQCISDMDCSYAGAVNANKCDDGVCKCGIYESCATPNNYCVLDTEGTQSYKCAECSEDSDCPINTPSCDQSTHTCYGCNYANISENPYQCNEGYTCSEDDQCLPSDCTIDADCAPGQICDSGTNKCSGSSTFTEEKKLDYRSVPWKYVLSHNQDMTEPSKCSHACADEKSCQFYNWLRYKRAEGVIDHVCNLYTANSISDLESFQDYRVDFHDSDEMAVSGVRKTPGPFSNCNGLNCIQNNDGAYIIVDADIDDEHAKKKSTSELYNLSDCDKHCRIEWMGDLPQKFPDGVGYASVFDSLEGTCACYSFSTDNYENKLIQSPGKDVIIKGIDFDE